MQNESEDLLDLQKIKEALVLRALQHGFLEPMISFFDEIILQWGDTETAHATIIGGRRIIVLGREFFNKRVRKTAYAVDVLMHEIMHHVFLHLLSGKFLKTKGYSPELQNLAMDAIINAYLHKVGCSAFMARFYRDADEGAFLRPDSHIFRMSDYGEDTGPVRKGLPFRRKFQEFYRRLYKLEVTLEEALEFFQEHFPQPHFGLILLGHHESGKPQSKAGQAGEGEASGVRESSGPGDGSGVFSVQAATSIMEAMGLIPPSVKVRNNFARIIRKVTTAVCRPGKLRQSFRLSQQPPATLAIREMVNIERGARWYRRGNYRLQEVWIFLDISGSVAGYLPFAAGLVASLRRSNLRVHCVCWADRLKEVPLEEICRGELPQDIGGGTNGTAVAQFIVEKKVAQAIIITDNHAGDVPRITAELHVCLFAEGTTEGSFMDSPNSYCYQLEI